jgi:RNA polymerase sigma-B factor
VTVRRSVGTADRAPDAEATSGGPRHAPDVRREPDGRTPAAGAGEDADLPEGVAHRDRDVDREAHARAGRLFVEMASLPQGDPRRVRLRDELVAMHLAVARHIAAKFRGRGEPGDDLEQVATVGLIHAVDRYDPERGIAFLAYAVPTMMGEVRRYFRDTAWAIRLPRRLSELHVALGRASRELSQTLGSAPTPSQLADHLGASLSDVREALEAGQSYRTASLDSLGADDESSPALVERLGADDPELEIVEHRAVLAPLLAQVPERERRILVMRFFEHLTQTQIAQRVGLSQMHVSRLLARTLSDLRERAVESPFGGVG